MTDQQSKTTAIDATHTYVGFNAAGEARAFVFDDSGYERDTASTVARWIKEGRTVQRMPIPEMRKAMIHRQDPSTQE